VVREDAVVAESSTIAHFSQSNSKGPEQGDVPALLRRVAASIEELGTAEVQDITFHSEDEDGGESWPYMTVYFHAADVEAVQ
jgi:hypothetical protein